MELRSQFSLQRSAHLIARLVSMNYKNYFIGFGVSFAVLALLVFYLAYSMHYIDTHLFTAIAYNFVFLSGLILTSTVYSEMHSPLKSHAYLTIPASTLEKLASYWFVTSIMFLAASYLLLYILFFAISGLSNLLFSIPFAYLNLNDLYVGKMVESYLVTHSMFFLGAVWFRRNNFLKTILTFVAALLCIGTVALLVLFSIFQQEITGSGTYSYRVIMNQLGCGQSCGSLLWLLVPLFVTVSYYKLKEKQV